MSASVYWVLVWYHIPVISACGKVRQEDWPLWVKRLIWTRKWGLSHPELIMSLKQTDKIRICTFSWEIKSSGKFEPPFLSLKHSAVFGQLLLLLNVVMVPILLQFSASSNCISRLCCLSHFCCFFVLFCLNFFSWDRVAWNSLCRSSWPEPHKDLDTSVSLG